MSRLEIAAGLVFSISVALIAWHVQEWRRTKKTAADDRERQFAWRRFRRRLQASSIIGLVGAMIFATSIVANPVTALAYWMAILLLVIWMMALAVGDAISSRNFLRAEHRRQVSEQIRFQADILRESQRANRPATDAGEGGD